MKTLTLAFTAIISLLLVSTAKIAADEISQFEGKWSVKKTNDEGRAFTQTIEIIKSGKFKFSIAADDSVVFYAEGDVKIEKAGPFNAMKFFNIRAGRSAGEAESVDEERTVVYKLDYDTWTVAANFDRDRDERPALDVYKKAK